MLPFLRPMADESRFSEQMQHATNSVILSVVRSAKSKNLRTIDTAKQNYNAKIISALRATALRWLRSETRLRVQPRLPSG